MIFKVKDMLFGKIAVLLCLCLVLNNTFMFKSYADESIAAQNPLFIPINTFVTAALIGSGMIAKNSQEALDSGSQLVNNIISQIKSSEVAKSEADSNYDSPYRVINGGKSEKPNNDNKDGKWVAAAAGALATHDIWANKDAIKDIMSKANSLGAYNKQTVTSGIVTSDKFKSTANVSNVSLQLANISNSAVSQFNAFLHSETWLKQGVNADDCYFAVSVNLNDIYRSNPSYPGLQIRIYHSDQNLKKLNISKNLYSYGLFSNQYGSINRYYSNGNTDGILFLNDDDVTLFMSAWDYIVKPSSSVSNISISGGKLSSDISYYNFYITAFNKYDSAFCGFIGIVPSPFQFTQNVYNVNQSFDENFQNWLQGQIQGLGDQIIDAVRLGITSVNPSWEPAQEQIQAGTSPNNVIYQFINNYENPENVPDDPQPNPDPDPEPSPSPAPEPIPDNEYLGNFLLPESITTKFPFCIPFDVARCLRLFSTSDREAPRWEADIGYGSSSYHVVIDLSMFDDVASFIRPLEYIVFLVGLAIGTRSLIRG